MRSVCLAWAIILIDFSLRIATQASTSSSGQVFQEVSDTATFRRITKLQVSTERADLVLEIDLDRIHKAITLPCELTRLTAKNLSLPQLRAQFSMLCKGEVEAWSSLANLLLTPGNRQDRDAQEDAQDRRRRFIVATMLTSLVAGVAGAIWGDSHNAEALHHLQDVQGRLVAALRQGEHRAQVSEEHVHELAGMLRDEERLQALRSSSETLGLVTLAAFINLARDTRRVSGALEQLLLHNRITPEIVAPGHLRDRLNRLEHEARRRGRTLITKSIVDACKLQASFGTYTSGKMRVVLHIPLRRQEDMFDVLEYIPTPFTTRRGRYAQVMNDPEELLAVDQKGSRWFSVTRRALAGYSRLQESRYSSSVGVIRTGSHPGCLWGLFRARDHSAHGECPVRITPEYPQAWRLSRRDYLVFHPRRELFEVRCKDRRLAAQFRGLRRVSLDDGCRGNNSALDVFPTHQALLHDKLVVVPPAPISLGQLPSFSAGSSSDQEKKLDELISKTTSGTEQHSEEQQLDDLQSIWRTGSPGLLGLTWAQALLCLVLLVALLSGASWATWFAWRRRRRRTRSRGPGSGFRCQTSTRKSRSRSPSRGRAQAAEQAAESLAQEDRSPSEMSSTKSLTPIGTTPKRKRQTRPGQQLELGERKRSDAESGTLGHADPGGSRFLAGICPSV